MTAPDVSVVIVSWNTRELLGAALHSIRLNVPQAEVIVVDNGSTDDSVAWVTAHHPEVRLIAAGRNLGFAAANNRGMQVARGRYVLLLNSDAELLPGAIQLLCACLDEERDIGIAGPTLIGSDGKRQPSCFGMPTWRTVLYDYVGLSRICADSHVFAGHFVTSPVDHQPVDVVWVTGACMMVQAKAISQIGMFDEDFFMYAEDTDWCLRMRAAGWRVVHVPDAVVLHHGGGSSSLIGSPATALRAHRSMLRLFRKHHSPSHIMLYRAVSLAANAARYVVSHETRRPLYGAVLRFLWRGR